MTPAAYNLFESLVRATITIAESALSKDKADDLRGDLTGKLTSLKVVMQREEAESLIQPMAQLVLALGKHVLGRPVKVSDGDVSKRDLEGIVNDLERRHEHDSAVREATLHPTGRCTCAGEGTCEWCKTHCADCGAPIREDGTCPRSHMEPGEEVEADAAGLDPLRWRLLKDEAGDPVLALYFNGRKDSLSQEQVEEIEEAVLPIIRGWGR